MKNGFDSEKYLKEQSEAIIARAGKFDGKLYLEFGGKLICDFHAARVLPGFDPDAKIKLLQRLKDKVDIIICIHAGAIEEKKMRELTIHFPLYNDVEKLYIALDEGAELKEARPYKNEKPVFFYGASSEQGCSASRPGMCHTNILS